MDTQPRDLRLVYPRMHGPDVADVQRLLGVPADGVLGPITGRAIVDWKRSRRIEPAPELTTDEQAALRADVPLEAAAEMERWAVARLAEQPPRSNRVPTLVAAAAKFGVASGLAAMGYPWCAFAAFLAALWHGGRTAELGLRKQAFNAVYTPAVLTAAKAGSFGLRLVPPAQAFRGDLALFDWNFASGEPTEHVGRPVSAPVDGRGRTVDGNSGGDGLVAVRERAIGSVRAFARDS